MNFETECKQHLLSLKNSSKNLTKQRKESTKSSNDLNPPFLLYSGKYLTLTATTITHSTYARDVYIWYIDADRERVDRGGSNIGM